MTEETARINRRTPRNKANSQSACGNDAISSRGPTARANEQIPIDRLSTSGATLIGEVYEDLLELLDEHPEHSAMRMWMWKDWQDHHGQD